MPDKKVLLSASILSSDFKNLEKEILSLNLSGIDEFHLDIMDGHFVQNISFGQPIIKSLRSLTDLPLEAHLMVDNPSDHIESLFDLGIDIFTFHFESKEQTSQIIRLLSEKEIKIGLAVNPDTKISEITPYLEFIDRVLFMTVYPGKGGQSYLSFVEEKISEFVNKYSNKNILIGVDGGIKAETIKQAYKSGARIFISGTGILNNELGYVGAVNELRKAILK